MKKSENKYELKHKKFASKNYTYTSKLSIYFSCKPMLSFFKRNVCVWGVKCIEHKIGKGWSDLLIKSIAEKWKNVAINCYKCRLLVAQLPAWELRKFIWEKFKYSFRLCGKHAFHKIAIFSVFCPTLKMQTYVG